MTPAKATVLLVDDEAAITANLAPFLERAGVPVQLGRQGDVVAR